MKPEYIAPHSIRLLAGTILPGLVALTPWLVLGYSRFWWTSVFLKNYPWAVVALIVVVSQLAGFVMASIGTWAEELITTQVFKAEMDQKKMIEVWKDYLNCNPRAKPIGHKYLGLLVTWLKFFTAMIPATFFFIVGLIWHQACWNTLTCGEFSAAVVALVLLNGWFFFSARATVKELHNVRTQLVEKADQTAS